MKALRKSARERDSRSQHQRTSNTPRASPTVTSGDSNGFKKQRSITEWTEPQPQTLAPSFEEHGFARHGVLETMAPLGQAPRAKDKQRARAMGEPPLRNVLAGKGDAAIGDDAASTPELTPARELDNNDAVPHAVPQQGAAVQAAFPAFEDEEDDDYEPAKPKKKARLSKTPVRVKTPVQGKSPLKNGHTKTTSISTSPAVQAIHIPKPEEDAVVQRMHIAINDAVARATPDNPIIGIALQKLLEQSRTETDLLGVMQSLINNNPTDEQAERFNTIIKRVKKEEKRKKLAPCVRQVFYDRDNSFFSQDPSPRASSEIVPDDSVSTVHDLQYQQSNAPLSSDQNDSATKESHRALQSALKDDQHPRHPFDSAPEFPAADHPAEAVPRQSSKSPRKRQAPNVNRVSDSAMDIDGALSTAAPTPAARTPDTGQSDDSELSDVNEEIVQKGPPEPAQTNGKVATAASIAASKKAKNAGGVPRVPKQGKGKNNVGKLFGKHANKQPPPTEEQRAEEARLWQERQSLASQQLIRQHDSDGLPISDVRFDDEILETESLTESQIAVGPPVDPSRPHRAGRLPNHGIKRFREETSRFSSPHFDSTAASRPSTPAAGPAPKRIKLTNGGPAARTKRS